MAHYDLIALKERLRIPEIWRHLGLPGQPSRNCSSPFRPDKKPSFSVFDQGRQWQDFATIQKGDAIDFIAIACDVGLGEATRRFVSMAGGEAALFAGSKIATHGKCSAEIATNALFTAQGREPLRLPQVHRPTLREIQAVAASRGLSVEAVSLASSLRTLLFAQVCRQPCWVLTDEARQIAEARRIDRQPFGPIGPLAERKAHTLRGSCKAWPVGTALLRRLPHVRALMLVEGGPDYLAALHLCLTASVYDVLPIAMLGRGAGSRIHADALGLLAGRRVRIYPHADADGGGDAGAQVWAGQLHQAGCQVDLVHISQLTLPDGAPVNDLNDAAVAYAAHDPEIKQLLP